MNRPVENKTELIDQVLSKEKELRGFGVEKLGIFGSFVKGNIHSNSDVDFFIEINKAQKNLKNFVALHDFLQNLLQRKVEIVTPQSLNPFIGKYILEEVEYVPFAA
ncbi:MAG: nucleotidyltransferase domain-containing protein [Chitinophagales bacterium]